MALTSEQWLRVKEIVVNALGISAEARGAFLVQASQGDAALLAEAVSLLAFEDSAPVGNFPPPMQDPAPALLNHRYRISRELGRGGFAIAYLALDEQLHNRHVVVKILIEAHADPYILRKFQEELHALASLEHPNIIAPLDNGLLPNGSPFIVTQFAEGRTLATILSEGPISTERLAQILLQIGRALEFTHARGIYHRDLKPANIMVQTFDDGTVHIRLIDFGIASFVGVGASVHTRIVGSLSHMSPEQLLGQVTPQSDVYALGVIAFQALTGELPFPSEGPVELAASQRHGLGHRMPRRLRPEIPHAAERLVVQALHVSPERRPANPRIFAEQLGAALLTPSIPSGGPHLIRWIVSLAVLLLVGATVLLRYHRSGSMSVVSHAAPSPVVSPLITQAAPPALAIRLLSPTNMAPQPDAQGNLALGAGTRFRLTASASHESYLYVFTRSKKDGPVRILFPSPTANGGLSRLESAHPVLIPQASWFTVGAQPDIEVFRLAQSPTPLAAFENMAHWANPVDRGAIRSAEDVAEVERTFADRPNALEWRSAQWVFSDYGNMATGWITINHP